MKQHISGLAVTKKKGKWHCANCGIKVINTPKWKQDHIDNCSKMKKIEIGQVWTPKSKDRPDVTVVDVLENTVILQQPNMKTLFTSEEVFLFRKDWLLKDYENKN